MPSKKGQLGLIVLIGLILIIIISIIVALSFMNKKVSESEIPKDIEYINIFLKSVSNNEVINSKYILVSNNSIISRGELSDWLNLIVDSNNSYDLYCWNEEYYLVNLSKEISEEEKIANASKIICNMSKIGDININYLGSIESKFINLNISSENLKDIKICESHTIGITKVNMLGLYCSYWNNISGFKEMEYFNKTKYSVPIYYPNNLRICSEYDWALNCRKFENNRCYIDESQIPNRLKNKVDTCWDLRRDLSKSDISIQFSLDTFNTNEKDEIEFYILDKESRYDGNLTKYEEINIENTWEDIGAEDKVIKIK